MKKNTYGGIWPRGDGNGFETQFINPLTKEKQRKSTKKIEEAIEFLKTSQINFYKEHNYLLPKGIFLNTDGRDTPFGFRVSFGKKSISKHFKLVQEALQFKKQFIADLI